MEARVARLESTTEQIQIDIGEIKIDIREIRKSMKEDFRVLFGSLITVALGLAWLMAKGFRWF
ncbi:hypothetical protein H8E88_01200 [candidate division KSB1 bacterium]|nr:hypothetical protein [candidate division KSB1 bacterium]